MNPTRIAFTALLCASATSAADDNALVGEYARAIDSLTGPLVNGIDFAGVCTEAAQRLAQEVAYATETQQKVAGLAKLKKAKACVADTEKLTSELRRLVARCGSESRAFNDLDTANMNPPPEGSDAAKRLPMVRQSARACISELEQLRKRLNKHSDLMDEVSPGWRG